MFGTTAASERGFIEQRIMMGGVALEHIMWERMVLNGILTKRQYKNKPAHLMLRDILSSVSIPLAVDPSVLPILAQFLADESIRQGHSLDGADVATQIRNRLMHPEDSQTRLYNTDGLLTEAWCLTRHYATLLILHGLSYEGPYRDLRRLSESIVSTVPWK